LPSTDSYFATTTCQVVVAATAAAAAAAVAVATLTLAPLALTSSAMLYYSVLLTKTGSATSASASWTAPWAN